MSDRAGTVRWVAAGAAVVAVLVWAGPVGAQSRSCVGNGGRNSLSVNHNDEVQTYKWSAGRCDVTVRIEGTVTMTPDFSGFATLSRGGEVRIDDDDGRTERRLVIRPGSGGSLDYAYRLGGRDAAFDAAGRAWLSDFLVELYRTGGFQAKPRAAWIFERQGVDGVLSEIALMRGDYAKRIYFQAVLEKDGLDTPTLGRVLTAAGETLKSDYELAQLLIEVAGRYALNETTRDAFLAAQRTIDSDYEKRRVLKVAIEGARLTPSQLSAVLDAAATIGSDYELAELLIQVSGQDMSTPESRNAFLKSAATIGSDYEHRRVLSALVKSERLTREQLGMVLASARTIGSDYELAELLLQVLEQGAVDETLHDAFLQAMDTMNSSYEYGRVASALLKRERAGR